MVFKYRSYEEVMNGTGHKDGLKDTIANLLEKYNCENVSKLPDSRRPQVEWLKKTESLLQGDDEAKSEIMNAMIFLLMCEIATTYGESIFDAARHNSKTRNGAFVSHGSSFLRNLQMNMGITPENPNINDEDILVLITNAKAFIEKHFYIDGDSRKGVRLKDERKEGTEDHPFKIEGLEVFRYLRICSDVRSEYDRRIIARNEQEYLASLADLASFKEQRARAAQPSGWGLNPFSLWGRTSSDSVSAQQAPTSSAPTPSA